MLCQLSYRGSTAKRRSQFSRLLSAALSVRRCLLGVVRIADRAHDGDPRGARGDDLARRSSRRYRRSRTTVVARARLRSGRGRARRRDVPPSSVSHGRGRRRCSRRRPRRSPPGRASTGRREGRGGARRATGQVVLADVDEVGLAQQREIRPVVDDERHAEPSCHLPSLHERDKKLAIGDRPSRGSGRCRLRPRSRPRETRRDPGRTPA